MYLPFQTSAVKISLTDAITQLGGWREVGPWKEISLNKPLPGLLDGVDGHEPIYMFRTEWGVIWTVGAASGTVRATRDLQGGVGAVLAGGGNGTVSAAQ